MTAVGRIVSGINKGNGWTALCEAVVALAVEDLRMKGKGRYVEAWRWDAARFLRGRAYELYEPHISEDLKSEVGLAREECERLTREERERLTREERERRRLEQDRILLAYHGTRTCRELAEMTGMGNSTVRDRLKSMGLRAKPARPGPRPRKAGEGGLETKARKEAEHV